MQVDASVSPSELQTRGQELAPFVSRPMDIPSGFLARQVPVKLLYTFDRDSRQMYVVKPSAPQRAYVPNAVDSVGLIDLASCLSAVLNVAPELSAFGPHSDHSVFSVDYSEDGLPLLAHGLFSQLATNSKTSQLFIAGRICRTQIHPQILEVQLYLQPLRKRSHSELGGSASAASVAAIAPAPPIGAGSMPAQTFRSMPASSNSPPMRQARSAVSMHTSSDEPVIGIKRISPRKRFAGTLVIPPSSPPRSIATEREDRPARQSRRSNKIDDQLNLALSLGESPDYCRHCGDIRTTAWRKVIINKQEVTLCNACGLYYRNKGVMRPKELFGKRRRREDSDFPTTNESEPEDRTPNDADLPDLSELPAGSTPKPSSDEPEPGPATPSSRENDPQLLETPNKLPDQFAGGSGSTRRWLRTHILSQSEEDVFEAFLQSPSKRGHADHRLVHIDLLAESNPSSSPPQFGIDDWF